MSRVEEVQGAACEQSVRSRTDEAHQLQDFGIGTDEQMLTIVEGKAVQRNGTRPATRLAGGFEDGDGGLRCGQLRSAGEPGPAGTHDGNAPVAAHDQPSRTQVVTASHSLRSGVSEVRCDNTRQPSRRISSSSAR